MRLIGLLVEGVPGTAGALEYRFEPGLNPWKQKGSLRLDALPDLLLTLFYPQSAEGEPLGPGKARKAAVTFEARGNTYLLSRDYTARKSRLSVLQPGTQDSFRELSAETRFIAETLARSAKLPSQRAFRALALAVPGRSDWTLADRDASRGEERDAASIDVAERLKNLKEERANLERTREIEARLDELQASLLAIDEKLGRFAAPREELERIRGEYEKYRKYDREGLVTPAAIAKLKAFPEFQERREGLLREAEERFHAAEAEVSLLPDRPEWKEPLFLGGAGAAFAVLVAAGARSDLPLLWTLLFLTSALAGGAGYFRGYRRLERLAAARKALRALEPERAGIEKRFEIESLAVRQFREAVGLDDTEEILSEIQRWDQLRPELAAAEERLRAVEAEVPEARLRAEREALQNEAAGLESTLSEIPPSSMNPNLLDLRIAELEARATLEAGRIPAREPSGTAPDAVAELLGAAAEAAGRPPAELMERARKAIDANVASLTGRTFTALDWAPGEGASFRRGDGAAVPWIGLSGDPRALLHFAVQFTLWQMLAAGEPLPLLLDLVSVSPSENLLKLTLAAARHGAKRAQVVVLAP